MKPHGLGLIIALLALLNLVVTFPACMKGNMSVLKGIAISAFILGFLLMFIAERVRVNEELLFNVVVGALIIAPIAALLDVLFAKR